MLLILPNFFISELEIAKEEAKESLKQRRDKVD
jgi:hypothetical protein